MKKSVKNISPAIFGIIVICFFLPFINVSCSDQKLMSFTAFQMVTGTTIQQPSMFGENTERQEVDPEPLAIAILIASKLSGCSWVEYPTVTFGYRCLNKLI